jgi:hypothetical protein
MAPIMGGLLSDMYGFRTTCDIMALSSIAFAGIYFAFNLLPWILKRKRNLEMKKNQKVVQF